LEKNYSTLIFFFILEFVGSVTVIVPSLLTGLLYKASKEDASIENIIFVLSENFLRELISFCKISGTIYPFSLILKVLLTIRSSS